MDRQKTLGNILTAARSGKERARELVRSRGFERLAHGVLGFCLSTASFSGVMSPFGVAYAAVCGQDALFASIGAFLGYVLTLGSQGLTYAAAVLILYTCRLVFRDSEIARSTYFMPLCAGIAILCTRGAVLLGLGAAAIALLACEAVICAGAGILFTSATQKIGRQNRLPVIWGRLVLIGALLLALLPLKLFGGIHLARAFAIMVVMTVACYGGASFGAGCGVLLGAFMDIAAGGGPFFVCTYGLAGLIGGVVSGKKKRFYCAAAYTVANGLATLWGHTHISAMPGLYECFIAAVLFTMLPERPFAGLDAAFARPVTASVPAGGQRAVAAEKLRAVSGAIGQLGSAIEAALGKTAPEKGEESISHVFDKASDSVCRRCPAAPGCWDRDYVSTYGALNDITPELRRKNHIEPADFPEHFASKCLDIKRFSGAVNEEYRSYLLRRAGERRMGEAKNLMSSQLGGIKDVLSDMADTVSLYPEYYPSLENKVRDIARAYAQGARASVYSDNGRMYVEVFTPEGEAPLGDSLAFSRSVTLALGRSFLPPQEIQVRNGNLTRMSECERFSVKVSCAVRKKQGEQVCGDSNMHLHTDDGRAIVMLSDGMGTGQAAHEMSNRSLELISSFIRSGCSLCESTRAVLPVLNARFEQWGFVTLDLFELNLFTGQARSLKYGAVPSFVLRAGKMHRIAGGAFPAGLEPLEEDKQEQQPALMKLKSGDRIVMMSDGVWEHEGVEGIIAGAGKKDASELAGELMSEAARAGAVDDMTVIVISVFERAE